VIIIHSCPHCGSGDILSNTGGYYCNSCYQWLGLGQQKEKHFMKRYYEKTSAINS